MINQSQFSCYIADRGSSKSLLSKIVVGTQSTHPLLSRDTGNFPPLTGFSTVRLGRVDRESAFLVGDNTGHHTGLQLPWSGWPLIIHGAEKETLT